MMMRLMTNNLAAIVMEKMFLMSYVCMTILVTIPVTASTVQVANPTTLRMSSP